MPDYVAVGEVLSARGVAGELKVRPLTSFPERFLNLEAVWVNKAPGPRLRRQVRRVRLHAGLVLLQLRGIDDRNQAEALKGALLEVSGDEVAPLPAGHYYVFDIVGLRVVTGEGEVLGEVADVLQTGANDVYVVRRAGRGDLLLPATREVVKEIDLAGGRMVVRLLPGLE